jgi:hypothetical protein
MIANALLRGNASTLAEIANHFGLARLRLQWRKLKMEVKRFPTDLRAVHTYETRSMPSCRVCKSSAVHEPMAVILPSTAALFEVLRHERDLHDFYLIGGTALAPHLAHRLSEDLDFITLAAMLPRKRIDNIIARLRARDLIRPSSRLR